MKKKIALFCGARFPDFQNINKTNNQNQHPLKVQNLNDFKLHINEFIKHLSRSYDLVYGGGHVGLMGLVADAFLENKAHVIGVIPEYLNTIEIQHKLITETQIVDDLHQRKAAMENLADCYLVFPGGVGTVDEFFEVLTLQSLNRHQKKIYIWNWNNMFSGIINYINNAIMMGFISEDILKLCIIEDDLTTLLKKIL